MISIVSPVYNAEKIVRELVNQISQVCIKNQWNYEIILVDDRSPDNSWREIELLGMENNAVKGIRLSKNFGQHYAITAGIQHTSGDNIVVMDCDLQDSPSDIPTLLNKSREGYDIVLTTKENRAHGTIKNLQSFLYFKVLNIFTGNSSVNHRVGNFSLLSRKAANEFLKVQDTHRHYLMIVRMLGFQVSYIPITHHDRFEGTTSYSTIKLIRHAIDGFVSQSLTLLYISIFVGLFFFCASMLGILYFLIQYFFYQVSPGFTSIVILILMQTGLTLFSIGILGIYVGKTFDQVRQRPLYIVDKRLNL